MTLTLEDCMCPICMCIFVEPVTMPCTHTLCYPCFKQNVEEASLTCPMCRLRISNWARRAAKTKTLLNKSLWGEIQALFPEKVQKRQSGQEDDSLEEEPVYVPIISIAKPGEIRQEYEEQLQRLQHQREAEKQKELEASEALIKKLQEEENMKNREQQSIEEHDRELAAELEKVMNEAGSDSPFNVLMNESKNRLTRSTSSVSSCSASSSRPPSTIETFINKMREAEKLKAADQAARNKSSVSPYPYSCISPSQKGNMNTESVRTSLSRSLSSRGLSLTSSRSCTSVSEMEEAEFPDCNNILSNHTPTNLSLRISSLGSVYDIEDTNIDDVDTSEKSKSRGGDRDTSDKNRSDSTVSSDSITQELSHFRPIKACPLTPPRKLASGKVVEPPLIRTTPRNLNKMDLGSPRRSLSDIDASSPIMQRRLSELEEERKCQVNKFSKSTSTGTSTSDAVRNLSSFICETSSPSRASGCINSESSKSHLEKKAILPELRPNENEFDMMPKLTKCVIPLEPIFNDDIGDFDIPPPPLLENFNIDNIRTDRTPVKEIKKKRGVSKSDTHLTDKRNVKELGNVNANKAKSRKLSGKGKKDFHSASTPQRSIKDWILSCGSRDSSSELLRDNIPCARGDTVDGATTDEVSCKNTKCKPSGDSVVATCTSDVNELQSAKLYPLRKRRKRTYDHSDFITPDWSPTKANRKLKMLMYSSDDVSDDEYAEDEGASRSKLKSKHGSKVQNKKRIRSERIDHEKVVKKRKVNASSDSTSQIKMSNSKLKSLKSLRLSKSVKSSQTKRSTSVKTIDRFWGTAHMDMSQSNNPKRMDTGISAVSSAVSVSTVSSEEQERIDRKLAEELAKQFEVEAKMNARFYRTKGSSDEYNFRNKRNVSVTDL